MKKTITLTEKVIISDPCYKVGFRGQTALDNILAGVWKVNVDDINNDPWGGRIRSLTVTHKEYPRTGIKELLSYITADSGQCGIFNADYYASRQPDDNYDNPQSWYRRICDITLNSPRWGTIDDAGAVTQSGFGDGMYPVYVARNEEGSIVGIRIKFL